jgi:hypothetical protein
LLRCAVCICVCKRPRVQVATQAPLCHCVLGRASCSGHIPVPRVDVTTPNLCAFAWASSQVSRLALRISDCVRSSDKQHMVWLTDALTAHAHTLCLVMLSFGSCQMGDFVIGYGKCVRVQSLGSSTPPPNDVGGFDIASAGYYEDGTTRILRFTRPYENSIPGHVSICTDGEPNCTPPEQYSILCVPPFMALFVCFHFWYDEIFWTRPGGILATHNHFAIPEVTLKGHSQPPSHYCRHLAALSQ